MAELREQVAALREELGAETDWTERIGSAAPPPVAVARMVVLGVAQSVWIVLLLAVVVIGVTALARRA